MLNNFSAIIIVLLFAGEDEFIFSHAIVYLLIFVMCLPFSRRYMVKLLPPKKFFEDYGRLAAFFPIITVFSVLLLWSQEPLIHSWQERLSRFYLPVVFIFFYRYILQTNEQLTALSEYNRLMKESREQVLIMRHDLRHDFRLIYMMLQSGNIAEAKDYLHKAEKLPASTSVKDFCSQPLINAALSVYISRAEKLGIKIRREDKFQSPGRP